MKKERILITGGAGFIGSNLISTLLKHDATIHLLLKKSTNQWRIAKYLSSKKVSVHFVDLLDASFLTQLVTKIQPTIIYHLAAHGATHAQNSPREIFESDVIGTLNLLEACKPIKYKLFLNIGSSSEYGFSKTPMSESTLLRPNSYYAVAKSAQTQLVCYIAQVQQKPIVTIRLFSVFGPYESAPKLFPTLFNASLTNSTITMGNRASAHDFVYIDDVVEGLLYTDVFSKRSGEIYNFGSGTQTSLEQVIATAEIVTKKPLKVVWQNTTMHRWDSAHWVADITKVKKTIPWKPRSFNDGLQMYWNWYKNNASLYA